MNRLQGMELVVAAARLGSFSEAARRAGIDKLVFSSTCATYGAPVRVPMDETHPQAPLNPYGRSKLMVEEILRDMDRYKGFRSVALRYFNAAGADPEGRIGEKHEPETHAIPLAIAAARGERDKFMLFGEDYDTRDGTCVRDYIHVLDLADAHVAALKWLLAGKESAAFNLGTGTGTTVKELVGPSSGARTGRSRWSRPRAATATPPAWWPTTARPARC